LLSFITPLLPSFSSTKKKQKNQKEKEKKAFLSTPKEIQKKQIAVSVHSSLNFSFKRKKPKQ
jgi:hypothetical protein